MVRALAAVERGRLLLAASAASLARSDALVSRSVPGRRVPHAASQPPGGAGQRLPGTGEEVVAAIHQRELRQRLAGTAVRLAETEEAAARGYESLAAREPGRAGHLRRAAVRAREAAVRARQIAADLSR